MNDAHDERGPSPVRPIVNGVAVVAVGFVVFVVAIWLVGGFVASLLGWSPGGDIGRTDGLYVENRTSQNLTVRVPRPDGSYSSGVATPVVSYGGNLGLLDRSGLDADGCTVGPIVATTDDGREYARHEEPLCLDASGNAVWVIGEPEATPAD